MNFWAVGYFNIGFWATNFWVPGGFEGTVTQSFSPPATQFFTLQAGQTLGGPSSAGQPFTVTSH